MNKMQDAEVRRMAVFKLRQAVRQIAQLERYTDNRATRACLEGVRAALRAANEDLQAQPPVVVEGDDETRLMLR